MKQKEALSSHVKLHGNFGSRRSPSLQGGDLEQGSLNQVLKVNATSGLTWMSGTPDGMCRERHPTHNPV